MKSIEIIPAIIPDTLADVKSASERYAPFTSFFQLDAADGKFAPNTTWMPQKGEMIPQEFSYEAHIMVADPHTVGLTYVRAGATTIIGHLEAFGGIENATLAFDEWKSEGAQSVAIAVLLQTDLAEIEPYLPYVDFVLFMTIGKIGVMGIPFEESSVARISQFHKEHPDVVISVDGGVSSVTIPKLAQAGATRFCVGSAIAKAPDPSLAYKTLKDLVEKSLI